METLATYLKKRGLSLDPVEVEYGTLSTEQKQMIAGIDNRALTLLVQERVNQLGKILLLDAIPEEVMVVRQSIVEVGSILNDHVKIQEDVKRTKEAETTPQTSPPVQEGKEGAL